MHFLAPPLGHAPAPRARFTRWTPAALILVLAWIVVAAPSGALAASSTMVPACSGVNVRTGTSTGTTIKARLTTGATVTVVAKVSGSSWSTTCPTAKSGSTWYRISAINGRSVSSLYGVTYLYAATGVLKAAPAATPSAADPFGSELTRLLNLDRVALGKPAYLVDARLAEIARDAAFTCPTNPAMQLRGRARDMADRGYFSHTVPGCYQSGTTVYSSLTIVRTVFGYATARSEILHWNGYGSAPTSYRLGCDIRGSNCAGGTTTAPYTVTVAQRNFMSSTAHRASELNSYQRVGCATAASSGKTYFACLFADGGSSPSPTPTPTPSPTPAPTPTPTPTPAPTPSPSPASSTMVPACSGVNVRTGTSTGTTIKARLTTGATVTVVAKVSGSSWSTTCPTAKSGSTWYRISAINGRSVSSLYGVTYLYAATGVLKAAPAAATGTTLATSTTFYGRGYGHGVGLSQYGARGRALAGQTSDEILAHYYPGTTPGTLAADMEIRVLLLDNLPATATSPLTVVGRGGAWGLRGETAAYPANARLRILPSSDAGLAGWRLIVDDPNGAILRDDPAPPDLRLEPRDPGTTLQLLSKASTYDLFRGTLRVILGTSTADVVNELPIESYLRGVVATEMPSDWPVAALTAQAIAARSYAAYRLRPGVSTFDVYDDTRSQVYQGVRRETKATDAVIAATASHILRSGSGAANTLFHSTGGGATENNENAFVSATGAKVAGPVSYLRGSPDRDPSGTPYDAAAPYAVWQTKAYSLPALSAIFAADSRTSVGALTALDLHDRGVSRRLISVTLIGSQGARTVSGDVFVAAFNVGRPAADPPLRSTLLDLVPIP